MAPNPYSSAAYQRARKAILGQPCWRCGHPATTGDHIPPLALHTHLQGTGCCEVWPACARCNYRTGGRIGGKHKAMHARARKAMLTDIPSRLW